MNTLLGAFTRSRVEVILLNTVKKYRGYLAVRV